jgi:hypothetical protein
MVCAQTARQRQMMEIAREEILSYFKRYTPRAEIQGNKVIGRAQYGKYPVSIEVTPTTGSGFTIMIDSTVKESYIIKWKANLEKNIAARAANL